MPSGIKLEKLAKRTSHELYNGGAKEDFFKHFLRQG